MALEEDSFKFCTALGVIGTADHWDLNLGYKIQFLVELLGVAEITAWCREPD